MRVQVPMKQPLQLDDYKQVSKLDKTATDYFGTKTYEKVREWVKTNFFR